MNSDKLYDLSDITEFIEDDDEQIGYFVSIFIDDVPVMLSNINQAFKSSEYEQLKFHAHKLKSSIDLFKIKDLQTDIRTIENLVNDRSDPEKLPALIDKLNSSLNLAIQQLKKDFNING
ncbi:MAG: Hpt domain-containing protein [Bacteroidetes bacterium]|nr:Hpt domain-containing protein [Bacteroidota bacterium]